MNDKYFKEIKTPFRTCELVKSSGYKMDNLHWHTYYEILFITKGERYTVFNSGNAHEGGCPQIYIHRPYAPHKSIVPRDSEYEFYVVYIYRNTLRSVGDIVDLSIFERACMLSILPTDAEACWLRTKCAELIEADRAGEHTESALLAALILNRTLKFSNCEVFTTRSEYMQDVLQYIEENLSGELTIEKLCQSFSVGHTKLLSDFKKATGTTFKKFLTDLRMSRARELLASGSSIINASLETGYSSEAHFIKAFREYYGITPGGMKG